MERHGIVGGGGGGLLLPYSKFWSITGEHLCFPVPWHCLNSLLYIVIDGILQIRIPKSKHSKLMQIRLRQTNMAGWKIPHVQREIHGLIHGGRA